MTDKTNWKLKYRLLEYDYNDLLEKLEANMSLFNKILAPMLRKNGLDPKEFMPKFITPEFNNVDRKTHHGLRRGDLVDYNHFGLNHKYCIVVWLDLLNNNRVQLQNEEEEIFPAVAEHCKITKKMEN